MCENVSLGRKVPGKVDSLACSKLTQPAVLGVTRQPLSVEVLRLFSAKP